jgi:Na+-transporting NADH:ubiquinone oxidoreductase subunit C
MQPENENEADEKKFDKDSIGNVLFIATSVCLVCSFLVAGLAVSLKSMQDANKKRDIMTNIVRVAGIQDRDIESAGSIEAFFSPPGENEEERVYIEDILIDLETGDSGIEIAREFLELGESVKDSEVIAAYDQFKAANSGEYSTKLDKAADIAGLEKVEKVSHVYLLRNPDGSIVKYIFPVRGKGLWSVLYGFLSVEPDFQTISGLTYYSHGETPGLGGEVDNPDWKKQWTLQENRRGQLVGKKIFGDDNEVKISVIKGKSKDPYEVDGLAGATITSNGVTNMLEFWFSETGFKSYIDKQKKASSGVTSVSVVSEGVSDNG